MTILAGVDAGATHTRALVIHDDGTPVGSGTGGPANPHNIGPGPAASEIARAIQTAAAGETPQVVVAGVAGLEDPELRRELRYALQALQPEREIHLYSDAAVALDGAFLGGPGIIVIAGTGSVAWGRNEKGEEARAGGWGHYVDDVGSGYDIGRHGLHAVLRAHDGRGEPTSLSRMLLKALEIDSPAQIGGTVRRTDPAQIASLARVVVQAADEGDAVARAILRGAVGELATLAAAVWQKLHFSPGHPVAPVDGVFAYARIRKAFAASLARRCPEAVVTTPRLPAVAGAVWRALMLKGFDLGESMVSRLDAGTRMTGETR